MEGILKRSTAVNVTVRVIASSDHLSGLTGAGLRATRDGGLGGGGELARGQLTGREHEAVMLTTRQAEALTLASQGYANKQIGQLMGISPYTAREHLQAAYARLGAVNRAEACVRYLQQQAS